jgi:predicted DNA-binding transcriptional regulator YafY
MRASRLLSLVLLLQSRGPWTAAELAAELAVSVRTIHRDVEALRRAGVPVQGERGPAGGYRLPGGYRTRLTGLTPGEADALFLAAPAGALGLGGLLADAQLKLLAALPPALRERADRAAHRFHVDHGAWFGAPEPVPHLTAVAAALWDGRRLRIRARGREREVDPLGLVQKGPAWYLVAATPRGERTFRVGRLEAAEVLDAPAAPPPPGFDLAKHWDAWSAAFEASLPLVPVRVRVAPRALPGLRRLVDTRRRHEIPIAAGDAAARLELEVWFERIEHAASLLSLGADVEVLDPPELRDRIARTARAVTELYAN